MLRTLIGIFLIAHGLVHSGLAAAPIPNDPASKPGTFFTSVTRSWLLTGMRLDGAAIRNVGFGLVGLATLSFLMTGLGVLGVPGLHAIWRGLAVLSASLSLVLLVVFWHPWLIFGIALDLGMLVSILWAHWPTSSMIGS